MDAIGTFTAFGAKTLKFFAQLKRNNDRAWFAGHTQGYVMRRRTVPDDSR